jgi:hypothetical protein
MDELKEVEKHELQGQIINVELEQLVKSEWNPNVMTAKQFDRLCRELQENGFVEPLQVFPLATGGYQLIGGHHRFEAAKVLGYPTVPCIVLDGDKFKDQDNLKFANMKLNVLRGEISPEKFVNMYLDLSKKHDKETMMEAMGFADEDQFKRLLGDLKSEIEKSDLPDKIKEKFKETANELKTIDDISNILNFLFNKFGNTLNYGFMVLVYGGHDHVYVALEDKNFKKTIDGLQDICKENQLQIEPFFKTLMTKEKIEELKTKYIQERQSPGEIPVEAPAPEAVQ